MKNDVALWMALATASVCLTVAFAMSAHSKDKPTGVLAREAGCAEIEAQLWDAGLRARDITAIVNRCNNSPVSIWIDPT